VTKRSFLFAYVGLVGLPLLLLLATLRVSTRSQSALPAGATAPVQTASQAPQETAAQSVPRVVTIIIQIAVIIVAVRALGFAFKFIGQPQVIGEMAAGILLGPSFLGSMAPRFSAILFPAPSLNYLNTISQLGIVLYMFLVGLELDLKDLKGQGRAALLTSHASIVVPFVSGSMLALFLYPRLSDGRVSLIAFASFMGAAMSITAFPVLARILTDRGMLGSRLGTLAIACAAVDDVTGWCILAYITLLIRAQDRARPPWATVLGSIAFVLIMVFAVRPLLRRLRAAYEKSGRLGEGLIALVLLLALSSALATDRLGIHLLFGAFLAGVIMPKDAAFSRHILDKFQSLTVVLLLPLYFAYTGLRMNLQGVRGGRMWLYCGVIIAVAIGGKLAGSMIASWAAGNDWRHAAALGVLLNTRGLMELVILNIGLDLGVISPPLFAMMVLMALVTTFITTPLLEWVYPLRLIRAESAKIPENFAA